MPNPIRSRMWNPTAWLLVLACYWCLLFIGTHLPVEAVGLLEPSNDKLVHALAFALLAILFSTTCRLFTRWLTLPSLVAMWIVVVAYAALDEWTQGYVGRDTNPWDWAADLLGAAVGFAGVYWWNARRRAGPPSD